MTMLRTESFADRKGATVKKLYTPTKDKVICQIIRPPGATKGGIYVPQQSDHPESPLSWVVACGPDCKQVKEGDLIMTCHNTMGMKLIVQSMELMQLQESDVVAVIDDPLSYLAKLDEILPLEVDVTGEKNSNNHPSVRKKLFKG